MGRAKKYATGVGSAKKVTSKKRVVKATGVKARSADSKPVKREREDKVQRSKGQSWSIDLIIGVIIFMLVVAIFYALLSSSDEEESIDGLRNDADAVIAISEGTDARSLGLIDQNGVIDNAKLDELCDLPYDEVKNRLGIESDFCIFIEDEDGNIIPCGTSNKIGIGNGQDVMISDTHPCGSTS